MTKGNHMKGQTNRRRWPRPWLVAALTGSLVLTAGGAIADTGVTIDPDSNDFTLAEGETWTEEITVTVPADTAAPTVDVYLLADTTGSMGGPIAAVRNGASEIVDGLIMALPDTDLQFGVGDFKDFPWDAYAFRHSVSITDDTDAVKAGINGWGASGGADGPEGQFYAFDQIAENRAPSNDGSPAGTIGWRSASTRILVVFADAPAHDPVCKEITATVSGHEVDYDITETSVTAKLVSAGITFIGISTLTGYPNGMDADPGSAGDYTGHCGSETLGTAGQASRIAAATGGVHQIGIDNELIVDVIVEEVLTAARTISSLTLVPAGDTTPFVAAITPSGGYGPFETTEDRTFTFEVDWEGVVAADTVDQVFTGTLDVVIDGSVATSKPVTITVPGEAEVLDEVLEEVLEDEVEEAEPAEPVEAVPTFTG